MSVRRLDPVQPEAASPSRGEPGLGEDDHRAIIPPGKQASAVIPLLWRAQEQNALGVEAGHRIRRPTCWAWPTSASGSGDLLHHVPAAAGGQDRPYPGLRHHALHAARRGGPEEGLPERIHHDPHHLSADGNFSWEEVECLGACVNAPMVQIFKDTYEDLTPESLEQLIDDLAAGRKVKVGPQIDRHHAAPEGGPDHADRAGASTAGNAQLQASRSRHRRLRRMHPRRLLLCTAPAAPAPAAKPVEAKPVAAHRAGRRARRRRSP